MRKLGGLDAMFLYSETEAAPMHVGSLMHLELPAGKTPRTFFRAFRSMIAKRLHLVDYQTHKLQDVPYQIDHPVWVKDADFDLDRHLHFSKLPRGKTLESYAAELYAPLMDRNRPLWDIWVIDINEPGRVGLLQKTHHAAIDGVSGVRAAELLFDFTPVPREVEPAPEDFWQTPTSSPIDVWNQSLQSLARYWWDTFNRMPVLAQTMADLWQREFNNGFTPRPTRTPLTAPRTRLNRAIDSGRAFARVDMSLPAIKALAKRFGVTINDVVLALSGEGLQRYFARHGEDLDEALIASCPVSLHKPGETAIRNRVSSINVSMANTAQDLVQRLLEVNASSNEAKANLADFRDVIPDDFGAPGLPLAMQQLAQAAQDGSAVELLPRMPMNLVLSNVPGFKETMYIAGARLLQQMPMSIVTHGAAVNLTVTSYTDQLFLGITAASRCVPDVDVLAACLEEACQDYLDLIEEAPRQAA